MVDEHLQQQLNEMTKSLQTIKNTVLALETQISGLQQYAANAGPAPLTTEEPAAPAPVEPVAPAPPQPRFRLTIARPPTWATLRWVARPAALRSTRPASGFTWLTSAATACRLLTAAPTQSLRPSPVFLGPTAWLTMACTTCSG